MKKPVPGGLSGMDFLLPRTTRNRQRWRDGEGAFGSCLHRDVAAINKPAQPAKQQKAEGRRVISPVLLPLTAGDGR